MTSDWAIPDPITTQEGFNTAYLLFSLIVNNVLQTSENKFILDARVQSFSLALKVKRKKGNKNIIYIVTLFEQEQSPAYWGRFFKLNTLLKSGLKRYPVDSCLQTCGLSCCSSSGSIGFYVRKDAGNFYINLNVFFLFQPPLR